MDTLRHCLHQRIVGRILPAIKVVAIQPENIGKALVAFTQILSIGESRLDSVVAQSGQPSDRLHRIQEDGLMMISRDLHDMVETSEVRLIGFAEVVVLEICSTGNKSKERPQSVGSSGIDVIGIVMAG